MASDIAGTFYVLSSSAIISFCLYQICNIIVIFVRLIQWKLKISTSVCTRRNWPKKFLRIITVYCREFCLDFWTVCVTYTLLKITTVENLVLSYNDLMFKIDEKSHSFVCLIVCRTVGKTCCRRTKGIVCGIIFN